MQQLPVGCFWFCHLLTHTCLRSTAGPDFFPRLSISNSYNELLELRWGKDAILRRPHNNLEELRSRTGDFLIVKRCLGVKKDGHGTNCGTDACPHRYTAVRRSMNKSMMKQNGESSCGGGPYIFQTCTPPWPQMLCWSIAMAVSSCTKVLSSWPTMCLCLLPCFA